MDPPTEGSTGAISCAQVLQNQLDQDCFTALATLTPAQFDWVVGRGFTGTFGTRSSVVMGRIRQVRAELPE